MTSPSHGGGRRFESGRAHRSFADQDPLWHFSISKLSTQLSTLRHTRVAQPLGALILDFEFDELCSYTEARSIGLASKSVDWIKRGSAAFWRATSGTITKQSMDNLRTNTLEHYQSMWSKSKILAFAKAFLAYLTKTRLDTRYQAFSVFFELPRTVKERMNVTRRIVTKDDIIRVLAFIKKAERQGDISPERSAQYSGFVILGAFTG
jgi:hypothetical protein